MRSMVLDVQSAASSFDERAQVVLETAQAGADACRAVGPHSLSVPTQKPLSSFDSRSWPACYTEFWFGDGAPNLERERPMLFEQVCPRNTTNTSTPPQNRALASVIGTFSGIAKKMLFPWHRVEEKNGKRKAQMAAGAGALWGSGDAQASTARPRAVFRFNGSHGLLWRRGRPGVNRRLLLREPWAAEPNKVRMSRAIGALPRERRR